MTTALVADGVTIWPPNLSPELPFSGSGRLCFFARLIPEYLAVLARIAFAIWLMVRNWPTDTMI